MPADTRVWPDAMAMHARFRGLRGWTGSIRAAGVRFALILVIHVAVVMALLQVSPEVRRQTAPMLVSIVPSPQPTPVQAPLPKPAAPGSGVQPAKVVASKPVQRKESATATAPSAITTEPSTVADAVDSVPAPGAAAADVSPSAVEGKSPPSTVVSTPSPPPPAVVPPRFDAAYLDNPRPEYPRAAKRMGEQGKVMLRVYVASSGTPEKVEIGTSSGSRRLDEAARQAVERWRFVPARRGDVPVAAWVIVPIAFALEG